MMTSLRLLLMLMMLWPISSVAEEYIDELIQQKKELETIISKNNKYGIYAPLELEAELSLIKKILFNDEVDQAVTELNAAGRKFLVFLENNDELYNNLDVEEWFVAADLLLKIDSVVSEKVAWGNLVIKIAICNKIFYWIFDYIESHKKSIELETFNKLLMTYKRLREHYPSNTSMLYIALRYYGVSTNLTVEGYGLSIPYSEELEMLDEELRSSLGGMSKVMDLVKSFSEKESQVMIGSYVDLYDNPVPWATSFSTDNFSDHWHYYEYLITAVSKTGIAAIQTITKEDLYEFYQQEYKSEAKFWMPRNAVRLVEKPDIYLVRALKALKQGILLDRIRRNVKSVRKRESTKGDQLRTTKLW
ncbi:MAG: hypothetical protein KZQ93_05585 [Candidatus Thiodiazotropha sp. (ex Monitilora ramsayi)]|nr:hypothetical protein [Candidatus Thiodiazotropha sp. (ex Monitilora ramsayi)]